MTPAEARAFNDGIETVRAIVRAAAARIEATGTRPLAEGFAIAALRQLEHDAAHLLIAPTLPAHLVPALPSA